MASRQLDDQALLAQFYQQQQQQDQVPTMTTTASLPYSTQQQQQSQQLQQYYYVQSQMPMNNAAYMYNNMNEGQGQNWWYPGYQQQMQSIGNYNNNCYYWQQQPEQQRPRQPVKAELNPDLAGIIPYSFYQTPNGASAKQSTANRHHHSQCEHACQTIKSSSTARPTAGGPHGHSQLAGTSSLNRIGNITSFKNPYGTRTRNSQQDLIQYRRIAARTIADANHSEKASKEKKEPPKKTQKKSKERLEPNGSFLRRLGQFVWSRHERGSIFSLKRKEGKDKPRSHQSAEGCSRAGTGNSHKRGFFRRLFGEVRDDGVTFHKSRCDSIYPTGVPADGSKRGTRTR